MLENFCLFSCVDNEFYESLKRLKFCREYQRWTILFLKKSIIIKNNYVTTVPLKFGIVL